MWIGRGEKLRFNLFLIGLCERLLPVQRTYGREELNEELEYDLHGGMLMGC